MEDAMIKNIIELYKEKKWKEIVGTYYDHPERAKLLWVFPSEDNFDFISQCLKELKCDKVLSIGCGSGLLEWMLSEATDISVTGVEVDAAWWRCKYAPPNFIPLHFTAPELGKDIIELLQEDYTALLFCYFNNKPGFDNYLKHYRGNVLLIIGPGEGEDVHTDPKPFGDVSDCWKLYNWQRVRNSRDFIAVYYKTNI